MKFMIDPKKIKLLANYVLIKPDQHYETIQFGGNETGIIFPDHRYEKDNKGNTNVVTHKERNYSVYGKVYSVPKSIKFNKEKIVDNLTQNTVRTKDKYGKDYIYDTSLFSECAILSNSSCIYGTEVEIEVGDIVKFSYMSHMVANDENIWVDTTEGEMMLVKYDKLVSVVNEKKEPIKMLNGFILIEPETEVAEEQGLLSGTTLASGIFIPTAKVKEKRSRKQQKGTVLCYGTMNKGYMQQLDKEDLPYKLKKGMGVVYDPRMSLGYEYQYHQEYSGKNLRIIQRKDIFYTC